MSSVYWLIDGSYIYKSIKQFQKTTQGQNFNLDYKKLKDKIKREICANEKLVAYYFNSTPDPATDQQNAFHSWLKSAKGPNIRVKLYSLKNYTFTCHNCKQILNKKVQKGVDVGIVTTALKFKDRYDKLVLSTGDGDFEDTFKYLKEDLNKEIIIVSFQHGLSTDIQQYADKVLFIDDFIEEIKDTRGTSIAPFDGADEVLDN